LAVLRPWPVVRSPTTKGQLVSAVSAQGCSGGKMEFDDGKYEVDDVRCNDGKTYDLDFNRSFELLKKKLEK
jgi:hypothetical protein